MDCSEFHNISLFQIIRNVFPIKQSNHPVNAGGLITVVVNSISIQYENISDGLHVHCLTWLNVTTSSNTPLDLLSNFNAPVLQTRLNTDDESEIFYDFCGLQPCQQDFKLN